jgi:antitoxin ChpS
MMSVPRAFLDQLHLHAGSQVEIDIDNGRLIVEPAKPRYSLEELLAQCDTPADMSADEREWLDSGHKKIHSSPTATSPAGGSARRMRLRFIQPKRPHNHETHGNICPS